MLKNVSKKNKINKCLTASQLRTAFIYRFFYYQAEDMHT